MFTSKEVLEKTGISRATLNNYISWGIVPKPQVLPPQANDGSAPRIGYFPDDILDRIGQRKRDGLSISQITARFAGSPEPVRSTPEVAPATTPPAHQPAQPPARPAAPVPFAAPATPALPLDEITHPAYLVNSRFEVVWANDGARSRTWPNHVPLSAGPEAPNVFKFLMRDAADKAADPVLGLHLGLARQRGVSVADVCQGVRQEQGALLANLYDRAPAFELSMVVRVRVERADTNSSTTSTSGGTYLYALTFAKATLFIHVPAEGSHFNLGQWLPPEPVSHAAPMLTDVAVLACDLQDARGLWSELPAGEYFELINEVWLSVEPIFRRHGGTSGKHPGEGLVCYFLAQEAAVHLWNAVAAAQEVRAAMGNISRQWRLRKGWVRDLHLNIGIDEGQEWRGRLRVGPDAGFTMLGETVHRALRISAFARDGAVWLTKNLVEKLPATARDRLKFGVRHRTETGEMVLVASTFARVEHAPGMDALVAELIAITVPEPDRAADTDPD